MFTCLPSNPIKQSSSYRNYFCNGENMKLNLSMKLNSIALMLYLYLCNHVHYVVLCCVQHKPLPPQCICVYLSLIMFGLLLGECEKDQVLLLIIHTNPNFGSTSNLFLKFSKIISRIIFCTLSFPAACMLCITVFEIWCYSCIKIVPC